MLSVVRLFLIYYKACEPDVFCLCEQLLSAAYADISVIESPTAKRVLGLTISLTAHLKLTFII